MKISVCMTQWPTCCTTYFENFGALKSQVLLFDHGAGFDQAGGPNLDDCSA